MTEFIQSLSFWQWIGCLAALWIVFGALGGLIKINFAKPDKKEAK